MIFLSQQGVITSLALASLFDCTTPSELVFDCEIMEFELNRDQKYIEFNNLDHYKQAYKYLHNNPNVLHYQIVTYNVTEKIMLVNSVPVFPGFGTSMKERLRHISDHKEYRQDNIILYIDALAPNSKDCLVSPMYDIQTKQTLREYYYPWKLNQTKELWDLAIQDPIVATGPRTKDFKPPDIRIKNKHCSCYKHIEFKVHNELLNDIEFPLNKSRANSELLNDIECCKLLSEDIQDKAWDILTSINCNGNYKSTTAIMIDCGSNTVIEIHCGYVKIS